MSEGLYGTKKSRKLSGKELSSSNSLSFSSNLASLISGSAVSKKKSAADKPNNPASSKSDIFTAHRARKRPAQEIEDDRGQRHKTGDEIGGISNDDLQRSKRRMEEKVRLYNAMKRGEYVQRGDGYDDRGLVDFDRKWAQGDTKSNSEDGDSSDSDGGELITYIDEFGRTRRGTKKEAERVARAARIEAAAEIDRANFSAFPERPSNLIYGDAVQAEAFNPERDIAIKMAELAKKRDRSATPPPPSHFNAKAEVRTRGTGFYAFSHDEVQRKTEMDELDRRRKETEEARKGQSVANGTDGTREPGDEDEATRFLDTIDLKPA